MKKFSDYARGELNFLGIQALYYVFCLGAIIICFMFTHSYIKLWIVTFLSFIGILLFWYNFRGHIIKDNDLDIWGKEQIEKYFICVESEQIKTSENWLDETFSSARLLNGEEENEITNAFVTNSFLHEIILSKQNPENRDFYREIKTHIYPYVSFTPTTGNIYKIDKMEPLVLLPDSRDTSDSLGRMFVFFKNKYQKNSPGRISYTSTKLNDVHAKFNEHIANILSKNYDKALHLFLSQEKFQIAGRKIKNGNGKSLFFITAIKKAGGQEIVLFPDETISEIFCKLEYILS